MEQEPPKQLEKSPFSQFEELVKRVVSAPKEEVDKLVKNERQKQKNTKPTSTQ